MLRLIPFADACDRLGIALQTGYNWYSTKRFPVPVVKRGRRSLVISEDLAEYLEQLTRGASKPQPSREPAPSRSRGRPRKPVVY